MKNCPRGWLAFIKTLRFSKERERTYMMQNKKKNERLPVPPVTYKDKIKLCNGRKNLRRRKALRWKLLSL